MTKFRLFWAVLITIITLCPAVSASEYGIEAPDYSVTVGEQTLPFPDCPVGSYFTDNGRACKPHPQGVCSNCKNTYGDLKLGAIQCKGFARMVFYRLFGNRGHDTEDKGRYIDVVENVKGADITAEYLRELFTSGEIKAGAHIRIQYTHSLVFLGCDGDFFYTYEANTNIPGDKHRYTCRVTVRKRTMAEAAEYFRKRGITYVRMPLSEDYPVVVEEKPEISPKDMPAIIKAFRVFEAILELMAV